jgi:acyl-CoA synthetase (AMP-forming)/AMP-acid ligase II
MTHGQTVRQFREWCAFAGLRAGDRYLIVNPFSHMFGYKAGWLASLLQGATIVPVPVFDVATVLSLVEAERITVLPGAPTIYRSILDHPRRKEFDLHTLRVASRAAADIPVELIREMRGRAAVSLDPDRLRPLGSRHVHGIAARRRRGDDRHDGGDAR